MIIINHYQFCYPFVTHSEDAKQLSREGVKPSERKIQPSLFVTRLLLRRLNPSPHRSSELFLGNIASGWDVKDDQNDESNLRLSDLQIPYSSTLSGTTKTFTMKHRMGLVELVPTAKAVTKTLTWTFNKTDGTYTETKSGTADGSVTASTAFIGNKPFTTTVSDVSRYWHIVKSTSASANTAMSFTCDEEQTDYWSAVSSGTDVGYGKYKSIEIKSDRTAQNLVALFSCQGTCQTITLPWYGTYKMECWGANGVNHSKAATGTHAATTHYGGISGYVSGNITMTKAKMLYVYVGDQTGFNGGGIVGPSNQYQFGSNGGGSTDIRIAKHIGGTWGYNSSTKAGDASLFTRIIVAGGGGGANNRWDDANNLFYGEGDGGYGGGLTGGTGQTVNNSGQNSYYYCYGGTQTTGGEAVGQGNYAGRSNNGRGCFGYAQQYGITESDYLIQSAAGSGWYGGGGICHSGGGGGSSFISGMTGCNGIDSSTGAHRGASQPSIIDGVTYTFSSPVMYAGNSASRPTNPGGNDGYAKITSQ